MRKLYTSLLLLLLAAALVVGLWSLLDTDATFSALEKRNLAEMPEFTWGGLLDGSYISELETYYSDTFPGRETLLGVNKQMNSFYYYSGSGENNVLVLDHSGGHEQGGESLRPEDMQPEDTQPENSRPTVPEQEQTPVEPVKPDDPTPPQTDDNPDEPEVTDPPEKEEEQIPESEVDMDAPFTSTGAIIIIGDRAMEVPTATNSVIESYAGAVGNLHNALGDDVRVISLVAPNGGQFYAYEEYRTGVHDQQVMIQHCYDSMDPDIVTVDAYTKIALHQKEYLYFRTDHHWTALGAYYAYTAFCETLGWEAVPLEQFETGTYEGFLGTMYGWTSQYPQSELLRQNPDTLTYYLPIVETHAKYYADADLENSTGYPVSVVYRGIQESQSNKYLCFLGGDHPATVVETAAEGPVCLVLKESYGNAFIPFLTSHYSKIIVIDPREFNRDGKPSLDLTSFAQEQGVDDLIVINYPFMINNSSYVAWLNRLVGIY